MLKLTIILVAVVVIAIMVAVALEADAQARHYDSRAAVLIATANPPDWYATETYHLIDTMMNDYANIRDFRISGEGHSAIVTLVDSDFKEYERQGPRPTWHKLVHEVIEDWQGAR